MNTPDIDVLDQWKSYLTNISSNLMELSEKTEFQLIKLKSADSTKGYSGITKARAKKCVEIMGELWRYYGLLSEVMDKAIDINNKRIFAYKAEEDIRELFEKTLIVTDREYVDINDRSLLGGQTKEKKSTPQNLLKYMKEAFEQLCSDIEEISSAEESVQSRLKNIKSDIEMLNTTSKRLGINNFPVFDTEKVVKIENDPIQGISELDKLVYSIEKYRASIKVIEDEYNEVALRLDKVRTILWELSTLVKNSKFAVIESQKIFGNTNSIQDPVSEEVLNSLQDWLEVLEDKLKEGSIRAVKVGASRLEQECLQKLEAEKQRYDYNSRDYNEWLDLKGQFKALLVKADIMKSRGLSENSSLDELIEKNHAALNANPVNLDSCRQLVRKLELSLKI